MKKTLKMIDAKSPVKAAIRMNQPRYKALH